MSRFLHIILRFLLFFMERSIKSTHSGVRVDTQAGGPIFQKSSEIFLGRSTRRNGDTNRPTEDGGIQCIRLDRHGFAPCCFVAQVHEPLYSINSSMTGRGAACHTDPVQNSARPRPSNRAGIPTDRIAAT